MCSQGKNSREQCAGKGEQRPGELKAGRPQRPAPGLLPWQPKAPKPTVEDNYDRPIKKPK